MSALVSIDMICDACGRRLPTTRTKVAGDADGQHVVRTVGDLTALDALPVGSVVMEGSSGAPVPGPFGIPVMPGVFHRFPDGWHVVSGHGVGTPEFDLGPLTVLHAPCEVLPCATIRALDATPETGGES